MRFNPPIRTVVHRANIKRTLQSSETTFDILQFFVLGNDFRRGQGFVGGLKQELAVNFTFPSSALIFGMSVHMPLFVQVDLIEFRKVSIS